MWTVILTITIVSYNGGIGMSTVLIDFDSESEADMCAEDYNSKTSLSGITWEAMVYETRKKKP